MCITNTRGSGTCSPSSNGFRAAYEPIARKIFVVDTPGVSSAKLDSFRWRRVTRPIYPLDREIKYKA